MVPEDSTGFFTLWVAIFTGVLAFSTIRLYKATRDTAQAALRQANVMLAAESPIPLLAGVKFVEYAQIPGEVSITDPVPGGPIPQNCRLLFGLENKGRTVLRFTEVCIEKFTGTQLPPVPVYQHRANFGLHLEKAIWMRFDDQQVAMTPQETNAANAIYANNGAFWVFGYLAWQNLLNERVEHKFLCRWDLQYGFVADARVGYV